MYTLPCFAEIISSFLLLGFGLNQWKFIIRKLSILTSLISTMVVVGLVLYISIIVINTYGMEFIFVMTSVVMFCLVLAIVLAVTLSVSRSAFAMKLNIRD